MPTVGGQATHWCSSEAIISVRQCVEWTFPSWALGGPHWVSHGEDIGRPALLNFMFAHGEWPTVLRMAVGMGRGRDAVDRIFFFFDTLFRNILVQLQIYDSIDQQTFFVIMIDLWKIRDWFSQIMRLLSRVLTALVPTLPLLPNIGDLTCWLSKALLLFVLFMASFFFVAFKLIGLNASECMSKNTHSVALLFRHTHQLLHERDKKPSRSPCYLQIRQKLIRNVVKCSALSALKADFVSDRTRPPK